MNKPINFDDQLKYIKLLSKDYPSIQSACTEIINLQAILQLPKGTEHFMSDLHGEHLAFSHILNNASGVIKAKIDVLLSKNISQKERSELATLIYYPRPKLALIKKSQTDYNDWCRLTLYRLIDICHLVASKYTRSKVRKALPADYAYIIDELLNADYSEHNRERYYGEIVDMIISLGRADDFITALSDVIKHLSVDRLHIIGDIYDRGSRPDKIMDTLLKYHCVDVQWGNHDILWIGAAAGHLACIAIVISNCLKYNNLEVLEMGYGINLRPLALFAQDNYKPSKLFYPVVGDEENTSEKDLSLLSVMLKAITMLQFKLEGQVIDRHPNYEMEDRLLLDKIDLATQTITINDVVYQLAEADFPTLDKNNPYGLSDEEVSVMENLKSAFLHSEKLQKHAKFLLNQGSVYKCHNGNLLYHGCIPLKADGSFEELTIKGETLSGKPMMDKVDLTVREAYFHLGETEASIRSLDFIWYLWCGKRSPLYGREKMTTFERAYIKDKSLYDEPKNPYYKLMNKESVCIDILKEFGLTHNRSHIINGHVPVKIIDGESPIKANGKLLVIDGGFCKAYQPQTGIAGYTLIYNSHGMRLVAYQPFEGVENCITNNYDIHSTVDVFETANNRMKVIDTDIGDDIKEKIEDLNLLVSAYKTGLI